MKFERKKVSDIPGAGKRGGSFIPIVEALKELPLGEMIEVHFETQNQISSMRAYIRLQFGSGRFAIRRAPAPQESYLIMHMEDVGPWQERAAK